MNYREKVLKVKDKRNHRVKGSLGTPHAYKWAMENNLIVPSMTSKEYTAIIREYFDTFIERLLTGKSAIFPYKLGEIDIKKVPTRLKIVDGKVYTTRPIDWDTTLKLWEEDEESRVKKIKVRQNVPYIYRLHYRKLKACYQNKIFYRIHFNRELKIRLAKLIKTEGGNTLLCSTRP